MCWCAQTGFKVRSASPIQLLVNFRVRAGFTCRYAQTGKCDKGLRVGAHR